MKHARLAPSGLLGMLGLLGRDLGTINPEQNRAPVMLPEEKWPHFPPSLRDYSSDPLVIEHNRKVEMLRIGVEEELKNKAAQKRARRAERRWK